MTKTATAPQSIDRAATLLVHLLDSEGPTTLAELTEAADLPKSTTSRLLSALERHGLVHQTGQRGTFEPGPAIMRFAHRGAVERSLLELAEPSMQALSDESGETVNLAVPSATGVEHLAQVDAHHFLGTGQWVGRQVGYHCSANGKIFLAFGAAELPEGRLNRLTPHTVTDREQLEAELAQVRDDDFATAIDELEVGLSAMAAPVRGPTGDVIAALTLSGPTMRLTPPRIAGLRPVLDQEARALSERLGNAKKEERAA
ncbi:MAG TPA: IclR family transcriptional regulator [Thermoleophilaceae bacterium]|jgi:DNA-binding IclR family transcriptional regulator